MYLDYSVSSGPFLRFSMRFEFLSEMFDHSVCETRDPSLTITPRGPKNLLEPKDLYRNIVNFPTLRLGTICLLLREKEE